MILLRFSSVSLLTGRCWTAWRTSWLLSGWLHCCNVFVLIPLTSQAVDCRAPESLVWLIRPKISSQSLLIASCPCRFHRLSANILRDSELSRFSAFSTACILNEWVDFSSIFFTSKKIRGDNYPDTGAFGCAKRLFLHKVTIRKRRWQYSKVADWIFIIVAA